MKISQNTVSALCLLSVFSCTQRESVPRPVAAPTPTSSQTPSPPPPTPQIQDARFTLEGVETDLWMLKEMKVLLKPDTKGILSVTAVPLALPNQPPDNALEVSFNGKSLKSCDFTAGTEKSCDVDLSTLTGGPSDNGRRELGFTAKRQFVPKDLGGGSKDPRGLSFHITKITIADKPV